MSFFKDFASRVWPSVKAQETDEPEAEEEEIVDPQKVLREQCAQRPKCVKLQERLTECNDRVNSRTKTEESCLEEVVDLFECVDHCVAKTLFTKLV